MHQRGTTSDRIAAVASAPVSITHPPHYPHTQPKSSSGKDMRRVTCLPLHVGNAGNAGTTPKPHRQGRRQVLTCMRMHTSKQQHAPHWHPAHNDERTLSTHVRPQ